MTMTYNVYHKTQYEYQSMVTFSHNLARLKPKETVGQSLESFALEVEPEAFEIHEFADMFGNPTHHLLVRAAHETLTVTGKSRVLLHEEAVERQIRQVEEESVSYEEGLRRLFGFDRRNIQAVPFLFETDSIPKGSEAIQEYVKESFAPKRDLYEAAHEFMERIFKDFKFVSGFSDVTTPIEEIFEAKKGVCQDFAQFAISALRSIGLPARYVSGYIETIPPEGKEKLFGSDASHAWFSLFIPGAGWADFDPTNNLVPREQHILLGYGRDYNDLSPLKGVVRSSGESELSVMVDVERV